MQYTGAKKMTAIQQPYDIILAGAHDAGKTTIFNSLKSAFEETQAYNFKFLKPSNRQGLRFESFQHQYLDCPRKIKLRLWDTASMEREGGVGTMTRAYFRQAIAVILVYDTLDLESLNKLLEWAKAVDETCDFKQHVVYALWGNEKGTLYSSAMNPVESYHVEGLLKSLPKSVCVESQLVCQMNGKDQMKVVENYETLVRTVDNCTREIERKIKQASVCVSEGEEPPTHRLDDEQHREEKESKGCC